MHELTKGVELVEGFGADSNEVPGSRRWTRPFLHLGDGGETDEAGLQQRGEECQCACTKVQQ